MAHVHSLVNWVVLGDILLVLHLLGRLAFKMRFLDRIDEYC